MLRFLIGALAALSLWLAPIAPLHAANGSACVPTTGTISGLTFAQSVNTGFAALISSNAGNTAPANDCSGVPVRGQFWLDTSTTPNLLKVYDGSQWAVIGGVDGTNHLWAPPVGGGTAILASSSTTDLGSVAPASVSITGTTGITSFGSSAVAGTLKFLRFADALTLTHNATSLIVPGGVSVTTAAGDQATLVHLGSGNWSVFSYTRASGQALANPSVPVGGLVDFAGFAVPDENYAFPYGQCLTRSSYPALTTALSITQSGTRVSGNETLTSVADTSQFGAGQAIEGSGIPANTTIVSVTSTSIVMSANATTSGTSDVTVFPYGGCGNTTEVKLPDLRGRAAVARDNMGGTAASRLTVAGGGINGAALGAAGGSQTKTLSIAEMPSHNHGGATGTPNVNLDHTHAVGTVVGVNQGTGGVVNVIGPGGATTSGANGSTMVHTHTISSQGGGEAFALMNPAQVVNKIIRIQ